MYSKSRVEIKYYSIQSHHCVQGTCTVSLNFRSGWGSYAMYSCVDSCCIYTVHIISPTPNRSSEMQCYECSGVFEIHEEKIFVFYTGLLHMMVYNISARIYNVYAFV